jgi:hypothetical protein
MTAPLDMNQLALATVADAHNIGAIVRPLGERATQRAQYSDAIQRAGVVIRPCHVVVIDRAQDPPIIIWRIGTRGRVTALTDDTITLDLGHQRLTLPFRDNRPEDERATALAAGDDVLLRGPLTEVATVFDRFDGDEPAHPERLRALLAGVVARHNQDGA